MKNRHKLYLIAITIVGIIIMAMLNFDQSNFLSNLLARAIQKVAKIVGDSHYSISSINLVVRKFGHFIEYLFLMVITYAVLHSHLKKELYVFVLSFLIVGSLAFIDEGIIQTFVSSGRNGQSYDLMIDFFGAIVGFTNIKLFQFLSYKDPS